MSLSISDDPFDKPPCRGCSSYLTEPYIKCAECGPSPFLLCLQVSAWQVHTNVIRALIYWQAIQSDWNEWNKCFYFSASPEDLNIRSTRVITDMKSWWVKLKLSACMLSQTQSSTTHSPFILTFNTDIRLPRPGAWMDGTGRDGPVGSSHGLWLWKLVSALTQWKSSLLCTTVLLNYLGLGTRKI